MNINYEKLRRDLIDYLGSATYYYPVLFMEINEVEVASDDDLICFARKYNFDLNNYKNCYKKHK